MKRAPNRCGVCGSHYDAIRYTDGVGCIRCWARSAACEAREAMEAVPHVWDTYHELTRSDFDGEGLEQFEIKVLDVVRATMPRRDERHFRFQHGRSK